MDDYERLADLDFGLMVWRQNLKRSTSLASTRQVCIRVKFSQRAFTYQQDLVNNLTLSSDVIGTISPHYPPGDQLSSTLQD